MRITRRAKTQDPSGAVVAYIVRLGGNPPANEPEGHHVDAMPSTSGSVKAYRITPTAKASRMTTEGVTAMSAYERGSGDMKSNVGHHREYKDKGVRGRDPPEGNSTDILAS